MFKKREGVPAWAIIFRGVDMETRRVTWTGQSLIDDQRRERYVVRTRPRSAKSRAYKRRPVFLVDAEACVTCEPGETEQDYRGVTRDVRGGINRILLDAGDGKERPYDVTASLIYELADAEDLRGMNLAAALPRTTLLLAMGAGAAAMVVLGMVLYVVRGVF